MTIDTFPIPEAALGQHTAVLGKTGSGKSSTAKLIVEHVAAEEARVCVLDPIKSDWWGMISSADGKRAGLPFNILGGPHGHVPLHASAGKAIGEIVARGELPLSIIDMADFAPGGLSQFFVDFAPALLRSMRGVVYLVLEEAHLFAPKERSGIGAENMAIHWAKTLATAGRSKGIRLIVVTQRTQALHNALLGSCDTLIAHRLTAPADQKPVLKWLEANVDKEVLAQVSSSLSSLPTGTAWLCSGEAKVSEKVAFPRISTFDNTATPTDNSDVPEAYLAAVDQGRLRALIGNAVVAAEADDPKALKAEIARLKAAAPARASAPDPAALAAADERGYQRGLDAGIVHGQTIGIALGLSRAQEAVNALRVPEIAKTAEPPARLTIAAPSLPVPAMVAEYLGVPEPAPVPVEPLFPPGQMKILRALSAWSALGQLSPTRAMLAALCGYAPRSRGFTDPLYSLHTAGAVAYPEAGTVELKAVVPAVPLAEARATMLGRLLPAQRSMLEHLVRGGVISREDLATALNYAPRSRGFTDPLYSLHSIGMVDYPAAGQVSLAGWLFGVLQEQADA